MPVAAVDVDREPLSPKHYVRSHASTFGSLDWEINPEAQTVRVKKRAHRSFRAGVLSTVRLHDLPPHFGNAMPLTSRHRAAVKHLMQTGTTAILCS
jgi:hypothetical protein